MKVDERQEEEEEFLRASAVASEEGEWLDGQNELTVKASQTSWRFRNSKLTLGENARCA